KSSFIIDPLEIFGSVLDFNYPERFFVDNFAVSKKQVQCGKTPCGFGSSEFLIEAGEQVQIFSFIGHTEQENYLNAFVHKITDKSYVEQKLTDCRQSIDKLENNISTFSQDSAYNFYCKQTYLDNLLRGGFPLNLKSDKEKSNMLYVFSRKHGDLERDYNNFLLEANYFSQGDGNYRDVNQNRRNDVWFNPLVEDANVLKFFNLLQLDGFNPLVVKSGRFKLNLKKEKILFESKHIVKGKDSFNLVIDFINDYFTPGGLFMFLENKNIALNVSLEEFLQIILSCCKKYEMSEHKEGFWIDHWTYNLDILESYLSIYPERLENIFLDKKEFVFYHNSAYVLPRDEKYVLENGKVRQFNAVAYAKSDIGAGNLVKTKYGKGNVYQTNLCVKILCLIANKMASFDAFGCGIEMEADKPGWYDSLNGLPGLLGSSVCESLELKRMIVFLLKVLQSLNLNPDAKISVFKELFDFLNGLSNLIFEYFNIRNVNKDFIFWDKACSLKESYRKKIRCGINGAEREFSFADLKNILSKMNNKIALSMGGMRDKNTGLFYTYFINEVIDYRKLKAIDGKNFKTNNQGLFYVRPKKFKQIHLPLFLEAQVHALRIEKERQKVKQIYKNVRKSSLYDQQLKMYKVNACLKEMPADIGRTRVFTPGWLENESVWLHMEYKYLLELLRTGLYAEFFIEFKNVLIPFQNPQQYGRSILENSSFLVSSVYPDKSLRGSGFVARLSGSTAEFVNMWLWMNVGANPFKVDSMGELCLEFKPVLPAWMFTLTKKDCVLYNAKGLEITFNLTKNSYAFNFLSSTLVVFHNPKRKNTFGKDCAKLCRIELIYRNQRKIKLKGNVIPAPYALGVRQGKFERINIALG
ncbi:MAG: cellobiose phosphorylase, partial [Candidatus Omnitrophota bacterium]